MKEQILSAITDFVKSLQTMFKIGAADFVKENFPKLVNNFWDDSKTDEENLKEIKELFDVNKNLNNATGNTEVTKVIEVFQQGWLDKIEKKENDNTRST